MKDSMTIKERMLSAIRFEEVDRLPFWPKIGTPYANMQSGEFKNVTTDQLWDYWQCDKQDGIPGCIDMKRSETEYKETVKDGIKTKEYITKHGTCIGIDRYDPISMSYHPMKMPIETVSDVKIMTVYYNDQKPYINKEKLKIQEEKYNTIGQNALSILCIGESPLMFFIEWLAGVENAHYLLFDHQTEVELLFDAIHSHLLSITKLLSENTNADCYYMVENTSTTLINPDHYEKYCLKHITEYGNILNENGKILALHMCGHLMDLLPMLSKTPAKLFEAFTSPTVGNTKLINGRKECPDKCLFGGTNAALWLRSPSDIISEIEKDLDELPNHRGIMMSSAGVMPSSCKPDTIKQVFEFIKNYDLRM